MLVEQERRKKQQAKPLLSTIVFVKEGLSHTAKPGRISCSQEGHHGGVDSAVGAGL